MKQLPIDDHLAEICAVLTERRNVIVTAAPGAGKSTRVPPALTSFGKVILLQPRRVAARSLARRISEEQRWELGREVGWQVRFDSNFTRDTRLLVATEGILTARMQSDPLLSEFAVVILDEFHERSIHSDVAIALTRQAQLARQELRIVVMSATLETSELARFLGDATVVSAGGRAFPVEITHVADTALKQTTEMLMKETSGHLLCFFPGAGEIEVAARELSGVEGEVMRLHGSLSAAEQDRVLAPGSKRKIILSTNIAETSLTIDGVTGVIDTGLHKVARYDTTRALDKLVLERIPRDSADQRAGRAGRTAPGRAVRMWDARLHLDPHREPEILRIDLAPTLLAIIAWGGDATSFEWFEAPDPQRISAAMELLARLGLVRDGRLTTEGKLAQRLPVHPRVARFLIEAGSGRRAALAAAVLSDARSTRLRASHQAAESDLFLMMDEAALSAAVNRQAAMIARAAQENAIAGGEASDDDLLRALMTAFPDRVGRRRERNSDRFILATGSGARLSRDSSVKTSEWIVALELIAISGEPTITLASGARSEWIAPTHREKVHELISGRPRALEREWYGGILLRECNADLDPDSALQLKRDEIRRAADADSELALLKKRALFAGVELDLETLFDAAASSGRKIPWLELLTYELRRQIDSGAPLTLQVPSGRSVRLDYTVEGEVRASVKLQELFGLVETPRIGRDRVAVTFLLLAPNGNPVQTTRDLRSFWASTYAEVRKDLRGRYPKHPWPDDPLTATPTAKTKRRG